MNKGFRLNKSLPKVGIRPVIDGRERGVRKGLEGQTMGALSHLLVETSLKSQFEALLKMYQIRSKNRFYNNTFVC